MKTFYLTGTFIVLMTSLCSGQNTCQKDKIYGIWKAIGSAYGEISTENVDSLKSLIHKHSGILIFDFNTNGIYTLSNPNHNLKKPFIRKGFFRIDEKTCDIILGNKKNAYRKSNLEVLFVDDKHLIIASDNNPHGYYTTLYTRQ